LCLTLNVHPDRGGVTCRGVAKGGARATASRGGQAVRGGSAGGSGARRLGPAGPRAARRCGSSVLLLRGGPAGSPAQRGSASGDVLLDCGLILTKIAGHFTK